MEKRSRFVVEAAVIAALYLALTWVSRIFGLADGAVQFRLSELLTVLPAMTPAAIPGLTVGCFLANISSPFGPPDWFFGALATLLAAILTRLLRKYRFRGLPILAPLPPILLNGLYAGALVVCFQEAGGFVPGNFTWPTFGAAAGLAAFGEAVVCLSGGYWILKLWDRLPLNEKRPPLSENRSGKKRRKEE